MIARDPGVRETFAVVASVRLRKIVAKPLRMSHGRDLNCTVEFVNISNTFQHHCLTFGENKNRSDFFKVSWNMKIAGIFIALLLTFPNTF